MDLFLADFAIVLGAGRGRVMARGLFGYTVWVGVEGEFVEVASRGSDE
jgi:hypothetical protein